MIKIFLCDVKDNYTIKQMFIEPGTTISVLLSEILGLSDSVNVGIYGKLLDKSYTLQDNDRVEFYERIIVDPKIKRKSRAKNE